MNNSLCDIPDSGTSPICYMDINLKDECIGRLMIRLFRDVFPAGVENFIGIASGKTYRVQKKGYGKYQYKKETRRTYQGCKFFNFLYNNYMISGDIYNNNGTDAGTIYCDKPIPNTCFGDYYYPFNKKGLIGLVPFINEQNGLTYYDSTFMITLDDIKPTNNLAELNCNHIVIGQVYCGLELIDKMNELIFPYAGRKYPEFVISKCGVYRTSSSGRKLRPSPCDEKVRYILPPCLPNNPDKCCPKEYCGEPICYGSDDEAEND